MMMINTSDIDFSDLNSVQEAIRILEEEIAGINAQIDDNNIWLNSAIRARKIKRRQAEDLKQKAGLINREKRSTKEQFMRAAEEILDADLYNKIMTRGKAINLG